MEKKTKINKSDAIREYLAANPGAMPKEIKAGLQRQGINPSNALINNVKYNRQRQAVATTTVAENPISFDDILTVKGFADRLGGILKAKETLSMLEQLT